MEVDGRYYDSVYWDTSGPRKVIDYSRPDVEDEAGDGAGGSVWVDEYSYSMVHT